MFEDVRTAIEGARSFMWRDLVGMAALGTAFFAALHLPALLSAV